MSIALVVAVVAVAILVIAASGRRVLSARREAERVRGVFSRYVSPAIVDEILERHDPRVLQGRSGYATILVCRIWNFALFAEQLGPTEMIRYLNEFYTLAGRSIQKHRGMIDKFLPDGMSGAFGFPLEDPLQEEHAIRASLDIIRLVDAMNVRWTQQGRKPFRIGIGINSGQVIAGDVGFAQRREYSVIGIPGIIASRLQEATETVHAYVLVSESTLDPVKHIFSTIPARTIPLRGMKGNIKAHIIRGVAKSFDEEELFLPPPSAFKETNVEPAPDDLWTEPAPEPKPPPALKSEPPKAAPASKDPPSPPEPPAAKRPRPVQAKLEIPEAKGFGAIDDTPALPDPPAAQEFYEDDSGRPPLKLPP